MTSQEFIISNIKELVRKFPKIKCRYEFDSFSNSHFVEVRPKEQYNSSQYAEYEINVILNFIQTYPYESVTFITEDNIVELDNPIFVLEGKLYQDEKLNVQHNIGIRINNLSYKQLPKISEEPKVSITENIYSTDYSNAVHYNYAIAA